MALALLAPTPTKFVNHFGAAAAAPTVLLAAALLRSPLLAAMQSGWQVGWQVGWHRHRASAIAAMPGKVSVACSIDNTATSSKRFTPSAKL